MKAHHRVFSRHSSFDGVWVSALLLCLVLQFTCVGGAIGATAGQWARDAIELQKDGRFAAAVSLLSTELRSPEARVKGPTYRGQLYYALGYIHEQQADIDIDLRDDMITQSFRNYSKVLDLIAHMDTIK